MAEIEKEIELKARQNDTDDSGALDREELQELIKDMTKGRKWHHTSIQRVQGGRLIIHIKIEQSNGS
jgi:hypothetical protein